ncbi:hypothetical protein IW261DRAFT_1341447 [Armillaria novae-zelandiae]|uniref:Uncharacterized protein n=1 Tax=Armillaria novae-zelandiae TaxID=153914 RepID=A0AA39NZC8_9AGAR|nr:hypothetical protein IW261DRAFT_1341447 [Armillaria novae-zelandiae]
MTQSLGGSDKVLQVNVTQQEAAQFDAIWANSHGTADCCNMVNFRICLLGPPACSWNKSAAAVLVRHLASEFRYSDDDYEGRKVLETAIMTHIRTLHGQYSQQNLTEAERESKRKKDVKESRKVTVSWSFLWESRRNLTFDVPELEGQRAALDSLGIDTMSSDKELQDLSTGQVIYQIKPPAWRALFLTNWLCFFDKVYWHKRFSNAIGANRGNTPRVHVPGSGFSTSKAFPSCLPRNTYRPEWLASQTPADVSMNVQPLPKMPDFYKHDEAYVA